MNGAYTKLFSSIVTSTVWMEDAHTKVVWITMLAMADREGDVAGSVPGLAHLAGVTVEQCDAALATFMAPDPRSRTKTEDGRRIEEIDGGWHLINHAKYRRMTSKAEIIERATERKRRYRERLAGRPALSTPVPKNRAEAEAEAEAEVSSVAKATGAKAPAITKTVFDEGIALLVKTGTPAKQARSIVGQWRMKAKNDDDRIANLIRKAIALDISQPVEWFSKALSMPDNDPWRGVDVS